MRKKAVVVLLLITTFLAACHNVEEYQPIESTVASTNQDKNQTEESVDQLPKIDENRERLKAKIIGVTTDLEFKNNWYIVQKGVQTMTISVDAENVDTIFFWIAETGTGTWGERTLIGFDVDGTDGWSIEWDFGDRIFHDHITIQALGSDHNTQAKTTINVHSLDESMEE